MKESVKTILQVIAGIVIAVLFYFTWLFTRPFDPPIVRIGVSILAGFLSILFLHYAGKGAG